MHLSIHVISLIHSYTYNPTNNNSLEVLTYTKERDEPRLEFLQVVRAWKQDPDAKYKRKWNIFMLVILDLNWTPK